jgi:hypothetical protein
MFPPIGEMYHLGGGGSLKRSEIDRIRDETTVAGKRPSDRVELFNFRI